MSTTSRTPKTEMDASPMSTMIFRCAPTASGARTYEDTIKRKPNTRTTRRTRSLM